MGLSRPSPRGHGLTFGHGAVGPLVGGKSRSHLVANPATSKRNAAVGTNSCQSPVQPCRSRSGSRSGCRRRCRGSSRPRPRGSGRPARRCRRTSRCGAGRCARRPAVTSSASARRCPSTARSGSPCSSAAARTRRRDARRPRVDLARGHRVRQERDGRHQVRTGHVAGRVQRLPVGHGEPHPPRARAPQPGPAAEVLPEIDDLPALTGPTCRARTELLRPPDGWSERRRAAR